MTTAHRLADALARHARTRPEQASLTGPDATLTHREVYERSLAVAAGLRARGIGPGSLVAVHGEKTAETVTALLGAVLAGAAYVPLDPSAPEERRRALLTDCGSPFLLARRERAGALTAQELPVPVVPVDSLDGDRAAVPAAAAGPDDLVYVLYTSGSTGRPKGVRIRHRSLEAFFEAVDPVLGITSEARCLNTTAFHFDGSVADLLLPLLRGAHVTLGPSVVLPAQVLGLIERERITHFTAVASTLTLLAGHRDGLAGRSLDALRTILTGAEILPPATVQNWLHAAPGLTVVNGYGPTETTCGVAFERISAREPGRTEPYPIGPPLPGVTVCFRDDGGTVTPAGPGEILLAGEQLMAGYLDRPEEEAAVFLDIDGVRHYRTGDLGELAADGTLRFHGRRDEEVKIRGYRINLNEVRRTLEGHPDVARAFVAAVPDPRQRLSLSCAVLVHDTGQEATAPGRPRPEDTEPAGDVPGEPALRPLPAPLATGLVAYASAALPRYMVPRELRLLTRMPVLSNGKPDRSRVAALLREAV